MLPYGELLADAGLVARLLDDGRVSVTNDDSLPDEARVVLSGEAAGLSASLQLFRCEDATPALLAELERLGREGGPTYRWVGGWVSCQELLPWVAGFAFPVATLQGLFQRVNAGAGQRASLQQIGPSSAPMSLPPSFLPGAGQVGGTAGATQRYGSIAATPGRAELEAQEARFSPSQPRPVGGGGALLIAGVVGVCGLLALGGLGLLYMRRSQGQVAGGNPSPPASPGVGDPQDSDPDEGPDDGLSAQEREYQEQARRRRQGKTGSGDPEQGENPRPGSGGPKADPYALAASVSADERRLGLERWRRQKEDLLDGARLKMIKTLGSRQGRDETLVLLESVRAAPPSTFEALDCIDLLPPSSSLWRELIEQIGKRELSDEERTLVAEVLKEAKETQDLLIEETLARVGRPRPGAVTRLVAARGVEWLEFGEGKTMCTNLPLDELAGLIESEEPKVREIGIKLVAAKGREGDAKETLKILAKHLGSEDVSLKRLAIEEVGSLGEGTGAWYLALAMMSETDTRTLEMFRNSLARLPAGDAVAILGKLAKHERPDRRRGAISALTVLENEEAIRILIKALEDSDRTVRLEALQGLATLVQNSELKLLVRTGVVHYRRIALDREDAEARRIARQLCLAIDGRLPR